MWPSVYSDSWKTVTRPSLWPMLVPGRAAQSPGDERGVHGALGCDLSSAQSTFCATQLSQAVMLTSSAAELGSLSLLLQCGVFCFSSALGAVVAFPGHSRWSSRDSLGAHVGCRHCRRRLHPPRRGAGPVDHFIRVPCLKERNQVKV